MSDTIQVSHHNDVIHSHPSSPTIPKDRKASFNAGQCPAVKNELSRKDTIDNAICPVVGAVSATLPPDHPKLTVESAGKTCPVTNATLEHHQDNVNRHPSVPEGR